MGQIWLISLQRYAVKLIQNLNFGTWIIKKVDESNVEN